MRWPLALTLLSCLPASLLAQEPFESNQGRTWASVEYMLWWIKTDRAPIPLVTSGTPGDPSQGVLGAPGTKVLFGQELDYGLHSGARILFGGWLGDEQLLGAEIGGFVLETHTIHGEFNSNRTDGAPVIARPYINALTGLEEASIITSPMDGLGGRYLGGIDIFADSRTWGGEANLRSLLFQGKRLRWELLGGFRYLGQKDQLRFSQSSTVLIPGSVGFDGAAAPAPNIISMRDYFETHNHFYGGQVGLNCQCRRGRLCLDVGGKVGLGSTRQEMEISGHTLMTDSTGFTLFRPGGLYVQPTNMGHFGRDRFSVVSELDLRLGFYLTTWLRLHLGYTLLCWSDVARPGNQINRVLDPRQVPTNLSFGGAPPGAQPDHRFASTNFWAQGVITGLEFKF